MPQKQNLENKISKTSLKEKVKRGISKALLPFVVAGSISVGALGLAGCATTGGYAGYNSNIGYDKFYDSYGDYKLVKKNNDVYLEKLDGSEAPKQITHTPNIEEVFAHFGWQGKSIVYVEDWGAGPSLSNGNRFFSTRFEGDDSTRKEISHDEYSAARDAGNK